MDGPGQVEIVDIRPDSTAELYVRRVSSTTAAIEIRSVLGVEIGVGLCHWHCVDVDEE